MFYPKKRRTQYLSLISVFAGIWTGKKYAKNGKKNCRNWVQGRNILSRVFQLTLVWKIEEYFSVVTLTPEPVS